MIEFPAVASPTVSIVVITYGGWEWVEPALGAVVEHTDPCYEVIVVDNASPDGTGQRVAEEVVGATLVFNDQNFGFGLAANQGALHARGRYLLFLNSDAYVQPGWLPPLLEALENDAGVGAVAPCLLEPDGRMQEAAGLVDGTAWVGQFGMGGDPDRLEYRFRREVDYASGAALLLRRRDFLRLGGFDPAYVMGYYEDVDLCFSLWERGLATVYEPRSRIMHLRGASGTQEMAMRHAVPNHAVFTRKWAPELAGRPPVSDLADYPHRLAAGRDARATERVLIVAAEVPGRGTRLAAVAGDLATRWPRTRVTLLACGLLPVAEPAAADALLARGVEVLWGEDWEPWFAGRRFHYSVVWVCGPDSFECFDDVLGRTQPQAVRVYDVEGLSLRRLDGWPDPARESAVAAAERRGARLVDIEQRAVAASDVICCASGEDAQAARALVPGRPVFTLPAARPTPIALPFEARSGLGFVAAGADDAALDVVLDDVMPHIWALDPAARLTVVGPADGRILGVPRIHAAARLPDRARLLVAPLGFVRGMASSLSDSMAAGLPFVTTSVGARGLGLGDLEAAVVADTPAGLAALACRLYSDAGQWQRVHRRLLEQRPPVAADSLDEVMAAVGMAPAVVHQ